MSEYILCKCVRACNIDGTAIRNQSNSGCFGCYHVGDYCLVRRVKIENLTRHNCTIYGKIIPRNTSLDYIGNNFSFLSNELEIVNNDVDLNIALDIINSNVNLKYYYSSRI